MLDKIGKPATANYKSPAHKLIKFFKGSRDKWKAKCRDAKYKLKLKTNNIKYLKNRNAELKARIKELEKQVDTLQNEKKTSKSDEIKEKFEISPAFHTYSAGHMLLFLQFILACCTSMRGAGNIFSIVSNFLKLGLPSPAWQTGRLWLLRLGYYKLLREKVKADDWIWIIDHTVQSGSEKCLVILGVRQSSLPSCGAGLTHEDVEPIALFPVRHSNGGIAHQQLAETIEKTDVPRQIVADYGSDIKSGVEKFCLEHDHTCYTYDIKHKTAAILKRELKDDEIWNDFTKLVAKTGSRVRQTALAGFAPPNQRSKARYMNVDKLLKWGQDTLFCLDREKSLADMGYDLEKADEKLGWLKEYREHLNDWELLFNTVDCVANLIKSEGLYKDCQITLHKKLSKYPDNERAANVREELISFVKEQSQNAKPGETLLGSSEVIESAIGRFKSLERNQAKSGFTSTLLAFPALLSKTTQDVIHKALEHVPTKKVHEWFKEKIGESVQSKRKKILELAKQRE